MNANRTLIELGTPFSQKYSARLSVDSYELTISVY
jgi:hypothetical protein